MPRPLTAIITATCLNAHYVFLSVPPPKHIFSAETFSPRQDTPFSPHQPAGSDFRTDISRTCRFPYEPNKNHRLPQVSALISHSNPLAGRREDSDDKGSLPERTTVTSVLRFKPSAGDNLANIACEAQHPALQSRPLRASVKMFVQCKFLHLTASSRSNTYVTSSASQNTFPFPFPLNIFPNITFPRSPRPA